MTITHSTVVVTADDGTSEVGSNEWNAAHTIATDLEITGGGTVAISGGTLVLGDDAAIAINPSGFNITGRLQTHGTTQDTTANVFARWSADASSSGINFAKSRHATAGSHTTLNAEDTMGYIRWLGSDGTEHRNSAAIQAVVDAATGANDVPSRLEFYVRASGAGSSTVRFKIDNAGNAIFVGPAARPDANDGASLGVSGTAWSDLFLASGAVINFAAGDVTLTHSADTLALAGTDVRLVITGGTVTTSHPLLDMTQTWNAGAVTFTGLKLDVTNTTSDATSRLLDLQVGSTTKMHVTVGGTLMTNAADSYTVAAYGLGNTTQWGVGYHSSETYKGMLIGGATHCAAWGNNIFNAKTLGLGDGFNPLTFLFSTAAQVIEQRNGTNAQSFKIYGTFTDASNYERGALNTGADYAELAAETAGTGDDNLDVRLTPAGTGNIRMFVGTATPAAGSTTARFTMGSTAGFGVYIGSGAPTVSAAQGSLYLRSDGSSTTTRAYINTDGGTTWTAISTAG